MFSLDLNLGQQKTKKQNLTLHLLLILSAAACILSCGSKSGGPTNNPITDLYGKGAYAWVETMVNWSCVYNVNDYTGSAADKFNSAQKEAVGAGGGVIYFPAGEYTFDDFLDIQSHIVIRGAPTGSQIAKNGKLPGNLNPTTKFSFPDREHFGIRNLDPKSINIGVVNIYSDGGAIMFWPGLTGSGESQFNLKNYWWYATEVIGQGANKLVFGNKIQHVSYKYPDPENIHLTNNQIPWPFSNPIAVYSDSNALVANNLLAQASRVTKVNYDLTGHSQTYPPITGTFNYPYDNHYGIDVNQVLLGGVAGKVSSSGKCGSSGYGVLNPVCFPWQFRRGLVIRDNYVYQNGRVGISWSGGGDGKTHGAGTQVLYNHVEVAQGTILYSLNGISVPFGSDTNENRGYNQQGYASNVTGNTGHINRQRAGLSPFLTVDGEGILQQAVGAGSGYRNIWQNNDLSGGTSGYIAFFDLPEVIDNDLFYNKVNPDQAIGALAENGVVRGNDCRGNSPPCSGLSK